MKHLFSLILILAASLAVMADDAAWKIYPVFDEKVAHVVDTPDLVYFTSQTFETNPNQDTFSSLFRYDKKGEELIVLSTSNILSGNSVRDIIYNPKKGYLAVLYKDYDIDLLYNNGKVVNIPYYRQASMSTQKTVNSLSIDPGHDRLYFATDFGYLAINDSKAEVAESRIYDAPFDAFCRVGDKYLAIHDGKLLAAEVTEPRLSLDQYDVVASLDNTGVFYPLNDSVCVLILGDSDNKSVKKLTLTNQGIDMEGVFNSIVHNAEYNSKGLTVTTDADLFLISYDGDITSIKRPEGYSNSAAASENMTEVWNGLKRKGLSSVKKSGETWSLTRDWMLPNAPSPYAASAFLNHNDYGLLMLSLGVNAATLDVYNFAPFQLSSYKNGRFKNHSPAYTNPDRTTMLLATNGMAIDPDKSDYIYITSYHNGIARINLKDPQDIIHFAWAKDPDAGKEGFVELNPVPVLNSNYSNIAGPYFDKKGNLWMSFADWDDTADPNPHFYCWTAADRKISVDAANVRGPQHVEFDAYMPITNTAVILPLLKTGTGLIAYANGSYNESILLLDANVTPTDPYDDKVYPFPRFIDSDGNALDIQYIRYFWEDPSTGFVWICHANGVCYFKPSEILQGNYQLYRVKVSRNDGTNLADYLLDGVTVNYITADAEGRKWFATAGGGIVCTSSDGREIIEEFNTANSPLPDDMVYTIGYNSADNSLMISTPQGYAEYKLTVSQSSSTKEDIRAYPNPVRPEYAGYVTITDIPSGSFVKIVDAGGNLVKELGIVSGFDILWDVSDSNFNRVKSGVYYIMVSPSDETSSYSTVGKILVMN